jgi:hypothetical protein
VGPYQATIQRFLRIDDLLRGEIGPFGAGPRALFPTGDKIIVLSAVKRRCYNRSVGWMPRALRASSNTNVVKRLMRHRTILYV